MTTLTEILSSRVKAEIFCLLFGHVERELHLHEIKRRSGSSVSAVRQELQRLVRLGLVEARKDGNRMYYRASKGHPLFVDLRNLVLKTSGLVEVLSDALKALKIRAAFVFGSIASGVERAHSDVDLMVVGETSFREVCDALSGTAVALGREVNPVAFSLEEFARRRKDDDHFLMTVLNAPKLFVIGDDDELERMAQQRLAPTASNVATRNTRLAKNRGARLAGRKG